MFTFAIYLLIFSFSHNALCEVAGVNKNVSERIVGGVSVSIYDFPYQVSLQTNGNHICGGSIISPSWVLSAAHCVYDGTYPVYTLTIRAGSTYRNYGGQVRSLSSYSTHPYYNSYTGDYDFALLLLSFPLLYNSAVQPIAMFYLPAPPPETSFIVSGWGKLQISDSNIPTNLRAVQLYTFDWNECNRRLYYSLTNRMICATAPGKDSCKGDSGGPGIIIVNGQKYLTGVVSFGYSMCNNDYLPSVYANVYVARHWIRNYAGLS